MGKYDIVQVGGTEDEQLVPDFRTNLSFRDLGNLILQSQTGICADSFLQHYYWFLGRSAIVLFGISDPLIFGHPENLNLLPDRRFLRPNQFDLYYSNDYKPEAFSPPEQVIEALKDFMGWKCATSYHDATQREVRRVRQQGVFQ